MIHVHVPAHVWTDVLLAADWYDAQSSGLAADLVDEINRTLVSISENPRLHPVVMAPLRRARVKRFHYGIFFVLKNDEAVVFAIDDLRRSPARLLKRLRKKDK